MGSIILGNYIKAMLLFSLLFNVSSGVFCQTDQISIIGQDKTLDVKILDITVDNVTFENINDHNVLMLPTKHITYLKLKTNKNQKYFTNDLLQALKKCNSTNIVWSGVDFDFVKINDLGQEYKYTNGLFRAVNNFILDPGGKFYALWSCSAPGCLSCIKKINCDPVNSRNENIKIQDCFKRAPDKSYTLSSIRGIINELDPGEFKEGIGMMFFYNVIDKSTEEIAGDLVFFDITSKEILLTIGDTLKCDGISMEWHWSKGFRDFLNDFRKEGKLYKEILRLYDSPSKK